MADGDIKPIVCDSGSGMVKVTIPWKELNFSTTQL
jgi:hypothetical protein